jgi:hypothetical protein
VTPESSAGSGKLIIGHSVSVTCSFCDAHYEERECIAALAKGLAICDVCIAEAATNCAAACEQTVAQWIEGVVAREEREAQQLVQ